MCCSRLENKDYILTPPGVAEFCSDLDINLFQDHQSIFRKYCVSSLCTTTMKWLFILVYTWSVNLKIWSSRSFLLWMKALCFVVVACLYNNSSFPSLASALHVSNTNRFLLLHSSSPGDQAVRNERFHGKTGLPDRSGCKPFHAPIRS